MPNGKFKRRGHNRQNDNQVTWADRDNRWTKKNYKPNSHRTNQEWQDKIRRMGPVLLDNNDVIMVATSGQKKPPFRKNDRGRGDSYKPGHNIDRRRTLAHSNSSWYTAVLLRAASKYEKDYILKVVENFVQPTSFNPVAPKVMNDDLFFLLDNHETARAVFQADQKITLIDGHRLNIRVRPFDPVVEVNDKMREAMKNVLATRYTAEPVKAINLSSFHLDPMFRSAGLFCPLNRAPVMTTCLQLIGDSVPDLVALDLSRNNIYGTLQMKIMVDKVPCLKILHLGFNKLRDVKVLDNLKGLPLTEIVLNDNELCGKFKDQENYVRAVRERFPKVIKLDNVELPPPILFIDEEVGKLPEMKASFLCDMANGATVTRQFLEQYYQLYDMADRTALGQAYHPDAEFSLTITYPMNQGDGRKFNSDNIPRMWQPYISMNRNLLGLAENKKVRMLHKGRNAVIKALSNLPPTRHDPASFAVDLVVFSPQIIELVVMGVFKETNRKENIFSFSRVFLLVSMESGGFCIINEMMTLQSATDDQIRKAFKSESISPGPSEVINPIVPVGAAMPVVPGAIPLDIQAKQNMVTQLAAKTNMNLAWSEKCLVETAWNFEQALYAFSELHKRGTIPPEAFTS